MPDTVLDLSGCNAISDAMDTITFYEIRLRRPGDDDHGDKVLRRLYPDGSADSLRKRAVQHARNLKVPDGFRITVYEMTETVYEAFSEDGPQFGGRAWRPSVGQWAVCQHGILGRVERIKMDRGRVLYLGSTLDGKSWQSRAPREPTTAEIQETIEWSKEDRERYSNILDRIFDH
jgi:hypothetical protein